jgi:hypothetical protein
MPCDGLPAVIPGSQPRRQSLLGQRSHRAHNWLELKEGVRERQLAVEVLRERGGAGVERRGRLLAFRIADSSEPSVLQGGQHGDQPEQGGGKREHRQPETASHGSSLARRFQPKWPPGRRFYVLNKVLAHP